MKISASVTLLLSHFALFKTATASLDARHGTSLHAAMTTAISDGGDNITTSIISTAFRFQTIVTHADADPVDARRRASLTRHHHRRRGGGGVRDKVGSRRSEDVGGSMAESGADYLPNECRESLPEPGTISGILNGTAKMSKTFTHNNLASLDSSANNSTNNSPNAAAAAAAAKTITTSTSPTFPALWQVDYHYTPTPQTFCRATNASTSASNYTAPSAARADDCETLYRLLGAAPGYWSVTDWDSDYDGKLWGGVVRFAECKFWVVRLDHEEGAVG